MNGGFLDYFDSRATNYTRDSNSLPWKWLRGRESKALLEAMRPLQGQSVLDLGCGAGFYTEKVLAQGALHVTAVDFSSKMLASFENTKNTKNTKITKILGDCATVEIDGRFSRIISAGLLEFVESPEAVLRNAKRFAQTNAIFGLLVPHKNVYSRGYVRYHRDHGKSGEEVRCFSNEEITSLALSTGWKVKHCQTIWPFTAVYRLEAA